MEMDRIGHASFVQMPEGKFTGHVVEEAFLYDEAEMLAQVLERPNLMVELYQNRFGCHFLVHAKSLGVGQVRGGDVDEPYAGKKSLQLGPHCPGSVQRL
jgi:hypothetical protein